jgi:hypothetical protein
MCRWKRDASFIRKTNRLASARPYLPPESAQPRPLHCRAEQLHILTKLIRIAAGSPKSSREPKAERICTIAKAIDILSTPTTADAISRLVHRIK